jgi:hypothetical protein
MLAPQLLPMIWVPDPGEPGGREKAPRWLLFAVLPVFKRFRTWFASSGAT